MKKEINGCRRIVLMFLVMFFVLNGRGTALNSLDVARAEESVEVKVKNSAGDIKTDSKKAARTLKRKVRNATGNHSVLKDLGDKVEDANDEYKNKVEKSRR